VSEKESCLQAAFVIHIYLSFSFFAALVPRHEWNSVEFRIVSNAVYHHDRIF